MKKERDPTQAEFEKLLNWLDADRDAQGKKYETVRYRLIKIFVSRRCVEAERLADEVMNRVTVRIDKVVETYEGNPTLYFYGVARKVLQEYSRERKPDELPMNCSEKNEAGKDEENEEELACLDQCLEQLPQEKRQLVLEFHQEEKRAKINHRKKLAAELGITSNALRILAHRIRQHLRKCVKACLEHGLAH